MISGYALHARRGVCSSMPSTPPARSLDFASHIGLAENGPSWAPFVTIRRPRATKRPVGTFGKLKSAKFPHDGPPRPYGGIGCDRVGVPGGAGAAGLGSARNSRKTARCRARMAQDAWGIGNGGRMGRGYRRKHYPSGILGAEFGAQFGAHLDQKRSQLRVIMDE